jgi:hypothetical protein
MARNSTFLSIMKYLALGFLLVYVWQSLKEGAETEGYDNIGYSEFHTPLNNSVHAPHPGKKCKEKCEECSGGLDNKCGAGNGCSSLSGKKLLPVLDPRFNMREICKECILLQGHLTDDEKSCKDCCYKHLLTLEALAEEAIGLDKDKKYKDLRKLPSTIRGLCKKLINGDDRYDIAQNIRDIRKKYMIKCFDAF